MNNVSMPLVSIITPYYKAKATIKQTIESVCNQTFPNWELLIIDDNSNDDIKSFIGDYLEHDQRITLLNNTQSKGAAGARNSGILNAKGRYVAFLDSDDLWAPEKLEAQVKFMQDEAVSFSYGDYYSFQNIDSHGLPQIKGAFFAPAELTFEDLCNTCSIGCLTVMLDRDALPDILLPNSDKEDYALWLTLTKNGARARNYGGNHSYYRVRSNSLSSNKFKEIARQYRVLRNVAGLSIPKAVIALAHYIYFGLKKHKNYRSSND